MVDDFSINSELRANDFIEVSWQVFCFGHNFTDFLYDREVRQGKVPDPVAFTCVCPLRDLTAPRSFVFLESSLLCSIEFWNEMANLVNKILSPLFGNEIGFVNHSFRKQPIGKK
jgi:hypothetical protein